VIDQSVVQVAEVTIGDGAWLGENVCIVGASVGRNCVIGANAVVTKNIPDHCIATGIPAKIIKRYNFELNDWQKTNESGDFI
jgi:acetyltransferase-like isoleucine patch superfamily enzyme